MIRDYTNDINKAVIWLGETALSHSKEICPVVTGRLKRSLHVIGEYDRATGNTTAVVRTTVLYAAAVELGGPYNTPRHYLAGGLEKARQAAPDVFAHYIGGRYK